MIPSMNRFLPSFLIVLAAACVPAHAEIRTEPELQPRLSTTSDRKSRRTPPPRVAATRLAEFSAPKSEVQLPGTPTKVGYARDVVALETPEAAAQSLEWEATASGGLKAALSVTSPGAAATRLAVRIDSAPAGTLFRFYPPSGESPFEIPLSEIEAQLRGSTASPAIFWSPVVEGETQVMEVEIPAGRNAAELKLAVPHASHLVTSADSGFFVAKAAAACNLDSMCYQTTWQTESNAVARMLFTDAGSTYVCSGTLVADRDTSTVIPFFLTANHCISTQASASTLQTYWFYRSSVCNGSARGNYQTRTGGATLLYASTSTDTALMRLNTTPPDGVGYVGWIVGSASAIGTAVTGIHHPTGDLQKISFGNVRGYRICTPTSDEGFSCSSSSAAASTFYSVTWASGITEGGSSGSGLFLDSGRYLIGQLYGGSGSCTAPVTDFYGRFDVAYGAALYKWLGTSNVTGTPMIEPDYDYSDLWWNAAESGWGLSLTQHGSALFAAWYVYDAAGNASWLVVPSGAWTSSTTFTGDVYATTGPDPRGAFDASRVTRTRVGTATLSFSARDRGTLSYTVNGVSGTKAITRQAFGAVSTVATPSYADMWWVPAESGWGLAVSQQYRSLFAVWYAYRADGQPVWYVMPDGAWVTSDTFSGTLYRTAAAPRTFLGASFDPATVTRSAVGTLSLRFSGTSAATMTFTVDGVSGTRQISRQPF